VAKKPRKVMPLRNDLLNPISPDNPVGENLRYAPIYDKIKEARREDDDAPQGEWKRERKSADWALTVKLISEALATKTKDLQLAAWLAEAMLRREGISGLREVLELTRGFLENFWDGLYPELEDGDAEFRSAPLQWIGDKLDVAVKQAPVTRGGYSCLQYRESRDVGTEEAASETYDKQKAREQKIKEGKLTAEKFDKDFAETPKAYYVALEQTIDGTIESLSQLSQLCDEKFGDVSPSFRALETALQDVRNQVHILLNVKREKEPDAVEPEPEPEEAPAEEVQEPAYEAPAAAAAAPAPAKKAAAKVSAAPETWEDACRLAATAAKFMRQKDPYNAAPYMLLRGLRWGEIRGYDGAIDQTKLAAPPSDLRQNLKRLALEKNWAEVLETAETAMGMECGRGWLDLQRYVCRACYELGGYYEPIGSAVLSGVLTLLKDFPRLPDMTMMDDTPTANAETLAWIKQVTPPPPEPIIVTVPAEPAPAPEPEPEPEPVFQYAAPSHNGDHDAAPPPPDAFDLAMQAARSGRASEGIEMLMREMMQEPSGRGRFQRKVQVAQLCLGTGKEAIALPILQEAVAEIERRKLEDWESREMVSPPLAMLYRCLAKNDAAPEERQRLYSWICRLDPLEAMNILR